MLLKSIYAGVRLAKCARDSARLLMLSRERQRHDDGRMAVEYNHGRTYTRSRAPRLYMVEGEPYVRAHVYVQLNITHASSLPSALVILLF